MYDAEEAANDAAREAEFARDCRAAAAELRDDMQSVMALAEATARKWAARGWLKQTETRASFDADTHQYVTRTVMVPQERAIADLAIIIKQNMEDAMSLSAAEAIEVAS